MNDYEELLDELRSKWLFPRNIQAADLIERLIRERDQALAINADFAKQIAALIADKREARPKAIDEAVAAIKEQKKVFQSKEYAGGPLGSLMEVFACNKCEEAVAALERKPE